MRDGLLWRWTGAEMEWAGDEGAGQNEKLGESERELRKRAWEDFLLAEWVTVRIGAYVASSGADTADAGRRPVAPDALLG